MPKDQFLCHAFSACEDAGISAALAVLQDDMHKFYDGVTHIMRDSSQY